MPEAAEVEKLRRQLLPAFVGRKVVRLTQPAPTPDMRKVAGNWPEFRAKLVDRRFLGVERHAKSLWLPLEGPGEEGWRIHLNSTGWFLPGNEVAKDTTHTDQIHRNFLHPTGPETIRIRVYLDDGQVWDYHDSRTWGLWEVVPKAYFDIYGPDWLQDPASARAALLECKTSRRIKLVVTDQRLTAGVGNYIACEACHEAGIHPLGSFKDLTEERRDRLAFAIHHQLTQALESDNHDHWKVFLKKGQPCECGGTVEYEKDAGAPKSRGSYFCRKCQT
jgi:formamidopyrimidine-DNA glycosylase